MIEKPEHARRPHGPHALTVRMGSVQNLSHFATRPHHDRDSRYAALFDRRLKNLGITQVRTPFRVPQANSIAERWVRSARQECLDHTFVFGEAHLRRVHTG